MLRGMMKKSVFVHGAYALCFNLLAATATVQAADYYVSTSGSDSNPGTAAAPFRTITRAYSAASAGTTIHVAPGTYTDYTSGWGIHLNKSGTASAPIVLESTVAGGAIIDGGNASDRNQGFYIDGNYNVIDGFEIRNCPHGGMSIWSSGNQIVNNHIHNNGNPASTSSNGQDGVYEDSGCSANLFAGNWIDHNGRSGSNLDHGLYLCGDGDRVFNNVLFANAASGLQIAGYTTVSNMKVYNNVMAWNGTTGIILWMSLSGIDIKNNIIYQNGHYGIGSYQATGSGVVVNNNVLYNNAYGNLDFVGGSSTYTYSQSGNIIADPRMVSESSSSLDPHLASGSPCIQAGVNLSSSFTTDMSGKARPSSGAWDLGVYVSGSAPSDTTPPTVSLTGPATGATVSGTSVTVSANASDNVGVTRVQFRLDGANLGSAVTAAPYQVTWNTTQTANGSHTLSAVAYDAAGNQGTSANISVTVNNATPPPGTNITIAATSGTISAPFVISGTAISQPAYTTLAASGQAVYTFTIATTGNYVVSALVNVPSQDSNSFWVNVDAQPTDPTMIWDVPLTTGFASQTVSWRGNGTVSTTSSSGLTAQFAPKVFRLSAGTHQLIVRGREGGAQLGTITIAPTTLPAN
jgi:hypothetical protein